MAKNSIGQPVKVDGNSGKGEDVKPLSEPQAVKPEPIKPEPVKPQETAPQVAQGPTMEEREAKLAALEQELAEREAALSREEASLKNIQQEVDATLKANPGVDPGTGPLLSDLNIPEDIARGADKDAPPRLRHRYAKYVRENLHGRTPLKNFEVTVKKSPKSIEQTFKLQAVDESDARRRAYQRAGIGTATEAATAKVIRI